MAQYQQRGRSWPWNLNKWHNINKEAEVGPKKTVKNILIINTLEELYSETPLLLDKTYRKTIHDEDKEEETSILIMSFKISHSSLISLEIRRRQPGYIDWWKSVTKLVVIFIYDPGFFKFRYFACMVTACCCIYFCIVHTPIACFITVVNLN